ncbi:MAG: hypothetical protein V2A77_00570, partial [Pseudomonadota bacterium]
MRHPLGFLQGLRIRGDMEQDVSPPTGRAAYRISAGAKLTGVDQWPTEASAIQRYSIGTRMEMGERVFRYSRIKTAADGMTGTPTRLDLGFGVASAVWAASDETSVVGAVAGVQGGRTLQYVSAAAIPAGRFNGGYINIGGGAAYGATMRILDQPVAAAPGTTITLVLEDPLPMNVAAGVACALFRSKYSAVYSPNQANAEAINNPNLQYLTILGIPLVEGLAGQFQWIQTWGPGFVVSGGGTEGQNIEERQLVWDNQDGSVQLVGPFYAGVRSFQYAGSL